MRSSRPRTAIKKEKAVELGLPLKYLDVRKEDGFIFIRYFLDHNSGKIYEQWYSPEQQEKQKKYRIDSMYKAKRKARAFVNRLKLKYGCAECGYKMHPVALHFNHLDVADKKTEVSKLVGTGRPLNEIKKEIRKCNILCANCHSIHTHIQHEQGVFINENSSTFS